MSSFIAYIYIYLYIYKMIIYCDIALHFCVLISLKIYELEALLALNSN